MKIVYRSLMAEILEARAFCALHHGRKIQEVSLSPAEWEELRGELLSRPYPQEIPKRTDKKFVLYGITIVKED